MCALGLGEVVNPMGTLSLDGYDGGHASSSSWAVVNLQRKLARALACLVALCLIPTNRQKVMVKAISSEIAVSLNQEQLVYVLGEKERRNGARSVSVKPGTRSDLLPISVPSDSLGTPCFSFFFLSC